MLKKILSPQTCAECKYCCVFDENDKWEMPASVSCYPQDDGILRCRHLTGNGCGLNDLIDKPLECKLYPFRVMQLDERMVIALSPYCEPVKRLPLAEILEFADGKKESFAALADENPEIVKEYRNDYIILKVI